MLILSLFPGVGLLDRAFEEQGFCIVRGPDLLWGGDIKAFNPPPDKFNGIIGGPPCQHWSCLANLVRTVHGEDSVKPDLIPEFTRCINEAKPEWFLMENVPNAPGPKPEGSEYKIQEILINNRDVPAEDESMGPIQNRIRKFYFGSRIFEPDLQIDYAVFENQVWAPAVLASGSMWSGKNKRIEGGKLTKNDIPKILKLQGLPADFDLPGFTVKEKVRAIGNGVPLFLGRAMAKAIKENIDGAIK